MSARSAAVTLPTRPQVNLLPPEVKAARGLARVKRWLAFAVVASMVAAAGLVYLAMMSQEAADEVLAAEVEETERLQREMTNYAEVPVVLADLDRAHRARELATSTEIRWRPYFHAIAASAPEGVRVENMRFEGATPMALASAPSSVLAGPTIGTITFTAQSLTLTDMEAWIRGLVDVSGFADPWYSQATLTEEEGTIYFNVTATVQVTDSAYALRFASVDAESGEEG